MNIDNNRGFTLIELIATIALLAIISLISFVSINKVIDNGKINECNTLVKNIETASKEYAGDNRYDETFIEGVLTNSQGKLIKDIDASILVAGNYLSMPIANPFNKEEIGPSDIKIRIELYKDYTVKDVWVYDKNSVMINCDTMEW